MYNWFNRHLKLGQPEPVVEKSFVPVPVKELSVYDAEHPRSKDATDANELRKYMTELSDRQIARLRPTDSASLDEFRKTIGRALRVMIGDSLPSGENIECRCVARAELMGRNHSEVLRLARKGTGEQIPAVFEYGPSFDGTVVVWIHPRGKRSLREAGKLVPEARSIVSKGAAILAPDVFMTGEFAGAKPAAVDEKYAGFTFGYNRPVLANRVHDILTVIACAKSREGARKVYLLGHEAAGPWVVIARALAGDLVDRTAADLNQFRFEGVRSNEDEMMLPGALKYGGLPSFAALCAPGKLLLHNPAKEQSTEYLKAAYQVAGAMEQLVVEQGKAPAEKVVNWLLR
jgi:hypothetical protein